MNNSSDEKSHNIDPNPASN